MLRESRFKYDKTGEPLVDQVNEAFVVFPFNPSYIDGLVISFLSEAPSGIDLYQELDHGDGRSEYIELSVNGFGSLSKRYFIHESFNGFGKQDVEYTVCCCFYEEFTKTEDIKEFKYSSADKNEIDCICQCLTFYFLTRGKNKEYIPLLVNTAPDLSKYIYMAEGINEQEDNPKD